MLDADSSLLIAIAVVLTLALSANGLAALAAACSRAHWFVRTAAYLAGLSLLLVIPATELVAMFALQAAIIAGGAALARRRATRRQAAQGFPAAEAPSQRPQFSMQTMLLATVIIGYAAAVGANTPALNADAWISLVAIGLTAGVATLLGSWTATRRGWRAWALILPVLYLSTCIAIPLVSVDWLLRSLWGWTGWPPVGDVMAGMRQDDAQANRAWFAIVAGMTLVAWGVTLAVVVGWSSSAGSFAAKRWAGRIIAATLVLLHAIPLGVIWFMLALPDPIPVVELPAPNGWDEIMAIAREAHQSAIIGGSVDTETSGQKVVKAEVDAYADAIARARAAVRREMSCRLTYTGFEFDGLEESRGLARLLQADAIAATWDDRDGDAAEILLDLYRLGARGRTGGLKINALVGIAVTGVSLKQLGELTPTVPHPADVARTLVDEFRRIEPWADFKRREHIWAQHYNGWHGRFTEAMSSLGFSDWNSDESFEDAWWRETAQTRLVALGLLAQQYRAENGRWPSTTLEALGDMDPADFVDPYDPTEQLLRLKVVDGEPLIYSVGENGVDDGGMTPDVENVYGYPSWNASTGDLRLDLMFGDPPAPASEDDAVDGNEESDEEAPSDANGAE